MLNNLIDQADLKKLEVLENEKILTNLEMAVKQQESRIVC